MGDFWPYVLLSFWLLLAFSFTWRSFSAERAFHRELNAREPMDDDKLHASCYENTHIPADIPRRLRPIYAEFFRVDPHKLRPGDHPPEMADIDNIDLIQAIEREFEVSISDADAEQIDGSFDSIIKYLAAEKAAQHGVAAARSRR